MAHQLSRCVVLVSLCIPFASIARAGEFKADQASPKIAHFHLSGQLTEVPQETPPLFSNAKVTSLKELIERLGNARKDDAVAAVVITYNGLGMGLGQLEEVRSELLKFKAVNKRVFVHVEGVTLATYALLSASSDFYVVPLTDVWLHGLYTESMYLKGALDWLGFKADIVHIGDFKSAGETLSRSGPSAPARENIEWLLDGLYDNLVNMIGEGRGLTAGQVKNLIDNGPYTAEGALAAGLVDGVEYRDDFMARLNDIYGDDVDIDSRYGEEDGLDVDMSNPFAFFSIFQELLSPKKTSSKDTIGIVYVEGAITPGYGDRSPFGGSGGAHSGDIRNALNEAAEDSHIKAVVLRVDSPGGSAMASEIILHAAQRVQEAGKPLIVSMGNVAASGGYYVSCSADAIFADETTITASIGVVGGKIVTSDMWTKLGVNWVSYQRGANADMLATDNEFTQKQRQHITDWMTEVYDVFKGHVTTGRKGKLTQPLDELAAGRVFTGRQALDRGLVDQIGGLSEAVEFAAKKAGIYDYDVRVVPKPKNLFEMIFNEMSGEGSRPTDIRAAVAQLGGMQTPGMEAMLPMLQRFDPQRVAALLEGINRVEMIHREGVAVVMPMVFSVR